MGGFYGNVTAQIISGTKDFILAIGYSIVHLMIMMEASAVTDKYLIAQCFFAHSTDLVIKTAKVLGKTDDVAKYTDVIKKY